MYWYFYLKDLETSSTAEKYQTKKKPETLFFLPVMPNLTQAAGVISLHSVFSSVSFSWWENPSRSGSVYLKSLKIRLPSGPNPRLSTGWVTFRAQWIQRSRQEDSATRWRRLTFKYFNSLFTPLLIWALVTGITD